jgi:hypothetical protein
MKPEISSNGKTVWVNKVGCIGRFCPMSGELMDGGVLTTMPPDWEEWTEAMFRTHGFKVAKKWKPRWVK